MLLAAAPLASDRRFVVKKANTPGAYDADNAPLSIATRAGCRGGDARRRNSHTGASGLERWREEEAEQYSYYGARH